VCGRLHGFAPESSLSLNRFLQHCLCGVLLCWNCWAVLLAVLVTACQLIVHLHQQLPA
jgi:hypothetical protein